MENVIISGIQDGFNEEEIKVKTISGNGSDLVRGSLRNHLWPSQAKLGQPIV